MVTKAISATVVEPIDMKDIPEGNWNGLWSGYTVEIQPKGKRINIEVDTGVRGLDIPCMVHVKHGTMSSIEVEAL